MIKHLKYSKGLHVLILCCFLLPFFNTSCQDSKEEKEGEEMKVTQMVERGDTTFITTAPDEASDESPIKFDVDTNKTSKKKDDLLSLTIVDKAPILKPILNPEKNIYSGLATIIDSFMFILLFLTPVSFLLLIISLTTKFIDKNARRTIILLELLAFISLLFARSLSFDCERVWGVWVAISLIGVLTIYDIYINRLLRQEQKTDPST